MSGTQRIHKSSLGLLIDVIKSKPTASKDIHLTIFVKRIKENHIQEIVHKWVAIMYSTALDAAVPVSEAERQARKKEREESRQGKAKKLAEELRVRALWDLVMPNGKPLHKCTFGYVAKVNPFLSTIAALGKGKMQKQIGKVFATAEALEAAATKKAHKKPSRK
jgi:ribosomal protein L12E/L44/L45/RPP1/RPP2